MADKFKDEGNKLFAGKKYAKAAEAYTRAIELDGFNKALYSNRSASFIELKRNDEALADAKKCVELAPEWPKSWFRLGMALEAAGNIADAATAFAKGVELEPSNAEFLACKRRCDSAAQASAPTTHTGATVASVPSRKQKPSLPMCVTHATKEIDVPSIEPRPTLESLAGRYDSVRIEKRRGKGRSLVATRDIPAHTEVFTEPAVCWYPQLGDDLGATIPGLLETAGRGPYAAVDPHAILKQLAPWAPESSLTDPSTGAASGSATGALSPAALPAMPAASFVVPVMAQNALGLCFDDDAPSDRRRVCAVCPVAAMMNHSCAPNCGYVGYYHVEQSSPLLAHRSSHTDCSSGWGSR